MCESGQEFPFPDALRLWDSLLSDPAGRMDFLLRLCAAMVLNVREELLQVDGCLGDVHMCGWVGGCPCVHGNAGPGTSSWSGHPLSGLLLCVLWPCPEASLFPPG